jgi:hypothetical protein
MKIRCKDIGIFIDGSVLYNSFVRFPDFQYLGKAGIKKIDLEVKRPALHVFIKVI